MAKDSCDRSLTFPTSTQPCEVVFARNQEPPMTASENYAQTAQPFGTASPSTTPKVAVVSAGISDGPKKIFVGSLPDGISEYTVRTAFAIYGTVTDVYVKPNCEPGRQWAFVSYATGNEAQDAKVSTDRLLTVPGATRPCEVLFARPSGADQQAAAQAAVPQQAVVHAAAVVTTSTPAAANKIFVGSLPGNVTEQALRAEFQAFGKILDVYVKPEGTCEIGRQWGFVSFTSAAEANRAKESTDRLLYFPDSERPAEVMIARGSGGGGASQQEVRQVVVAQAASPHQPPPPSTPPPFDLHATSWRLYYTNEGLPYYHNYTTNKTQWERPSDLPQLYAAARGVAVPQRRAPF